MSRDVYGMVFDIQRFSVHDGPGIRTVVFLKGCSLACAWCHNPEAITGGKEIAYHAGRCATGCDACESACPRSAIGHDRERRIDFTRCDACGVCVDACASNAFVRIGREMSAAEILDTVARDRAFYDASGGGVTFSGGEPLLQLPFLQQALPRLLAAAIHVAMETAGSVSWESINALLAHVDLWLFDLKLVDSARHEKFTGHRNERILANLGRLVETGARVCVRMPVVPGINTGDENIARTADLLRALGVSRLILLPYNQMWETKLSHLSCARQPLGLKAASTEYYASLRDAFAGEGVQARIEG